MTTIPVADIPPSQLRKATEAIAAATGHAPPNLYRPAGGLSNDAVRAEAGKQGLAEILWDVIPFDWINDATWQPPPTCSKKPKSNPARWCYCTTPTPAQSTWCINFFPY